jgi:peroxiredoxin
MPNNTNLYRTAGLLIVIVCAGLFSPAAQAQSNTQPSQSNLLSPVLSARDADTAWQELVDANKNPPTAPAIWSMNPPTPKEKQSFYLPYLNALVGQAKDFYTRFPTNKNAVSARLMEFQLLLVTVEWGQTNQQARLGAVEKSLLSEPSLAGDQHFQIMWMIALHSPPSEARTMFADISQNASSEKLKDAASQELAKLDQLGKPITLQFTAVDGRKVDLAKLKGKVVLVDFWATWCPPCVAEVPDVKETYARFHNQGFDIIGISLDKEKDKLTQFVAEHKIPWPQYFDGLYWQNIYARQFGIDSIPAMWLIDKKGDLRVVDARSDLSGQVQKLLAE